MVPPPPPPAATGSVAPMVWISNNTQHIDRTFSSPFTEALLQDRLKREFKMQMRANIRKLFDRFGYIRCEGAANVAPLVASIPDELSYVFVETYPGDAGGDTVTIAECLLERVLKRAATLQSEIASAGGGGGDGGSGSGSGSGGGSSGDVASGGAGGGGTGGDSADADMDSPHVVALTPAAVSNRELLLVLGALEALCVRYQPCREGLLRGMRAAAVVSLLAIDEPALNIATLQCLMAVCHNSPQNMRALNGSVVFGVVLRLFEEASARDRDAQAEASGGGSDNGSSDAGSDNGSLSGGGGGGGGVRPVSAAEQRLAYGEFLVYYCQKLGGAERDVYAMLKSLGQTFTGQCMSRLVETERAHDRLHVFGRNLGGIERLEVPADSDRTAALVYDRLVVAPPVEEALPARPEKEVSGGGGSGGSSSSRRESKRKKERSASVSAKSAAADGDGDGGGDGGDGRELITSNSSGSGGSGGGSSRSSKRHNRRKSKGGKSSKIKQSDRRERAGGKDPVSSGSSSGASASSSTKQSGGSSAAATGHNSDGDGDGGGGSDGGDGAVPMGEERGSGEFGLAVGSMRPLSRRVSTPSKGRSKDTGRPSIPHGVSLQARNLQINKRTSPGDTSPGAPGSSGSGTNSNTASGGASSSTSGRSSHSSSGSASREVSPRKRKTKRVGDDG